MMYLFESVEIKTALHNYSSWLPAEIIKKKTFSGFVFLHMTVKCCRIPKQLENYKAAVFSTMKYVGLRSV